MKRKAPKNNTEAGKFLAAKSLIEKIVAVKHGKALTPEIVAVERWQILIARGRKEGHETIETDDLQWLADTFGRALLELDSAVLRRFADAIDAVRSTPEPKSTRAQVFNAACVGTWIEGGVETLTELGKKAAYKGGDDALRNLVKRMGGKLQKEPGGRPKKPRRGSAEKGRSTS